MTKQPPAGRWWWAGLAIGGAIGGFSRAGLLADVGKTRPVVRVVWLVSLGQTHDLLLAPVVHLAGRWVWRALEAWRWPLQVELVVVAVLALAAARHLRARGWTVRIRAP
ncbi:MAG TPA: hypothetical protein VJ735_01575 [Actinomycetes bacterium]|nr:hypothetical protein [Actinomycetes bacterium]